MQLHYHRLVPAALALAGFPSLLSTQNGGSGVVYSRTLSDPDAGRFGADAQSYHCTLDDDAAFIPDEGFLRTMPTLQVDILTRSEATTAVFQVTNGGSRGLAIVYADFEGSATTSYGPFDSLPGSPNAISVASIVLDELGNGLVETPYLIDRPLFPPPFQALLINPGKPTRRVTPIAKRGWYGGPGDTVPPGIGGPGGTCGGSPSCGFDVSDPGTCHVTKAPILYPGLSPSWGPAPTCMQASGVAPNPVWVAQITVQDLLSACGSISGTGTIKICVPFTCAEGIDAIFHYTSIPFQHFPNGVPRAGGGSIPICGLGFEINGNSAWNSGTSYYHCQSCLPVQDAVEILLDCGCLNDILQEYMWLQLYGQSNSYINGSSVVFVVIIKCCGEGCDADCGESQNPVRF